MSGGNLKNVLLGYGLHNFVHFVYFIRFLFPFFVIFTDYLHVVHILFIFYCYNNFTVKIIPPLKTLDKFFHNSPDAERCPGTPHFKALYSYCSISSRTKTLSRFRESVRFTLLRPLPDSGRYSGFHY